MKKYIIKWDIGWGENAEVVECENIDEAEKKAYEAAREDFENQAQYEAVEYNQEDVDNYGLE